MDYFIRKPNRTHRKNNKRIVSKFKDFEDFEFVKNQTKAQRRLKKKYARAAKKSERDSIEREIEDILNS